MRRMDMSPCRSCKAMVYWCRTAATGKAMPLTEDDAAGNVIVDVVGLAHAFRDHQAAVAGGEADFDRFGVVASFYVSHHAVCPAGAAWRGKQRGQDGEPAQLSLDAA